MPNNTQVDPENASSGHPALCRLSIVRALGKRKLRIAVVWFLFAAVSVAVVRLLPAVYLAESVVLIDSQKIPEKFVSATVASDLEDRIAAIRQTLLSGGNLKKVVDEFGLYAEERKTHFEEEVLEIMRKNISITVEAVGDGKSKRPGAFRIGFQGPNPNLVMRVANRLTDLYVEQNLKTRESEAAGTADFLDTQLAESKKRLDELELAFSTYKLQHNGQLPQQESSLTNTLARLRTEMDTNRDAMNRAQQTRVILESNLNATEATLAAQVRAWQALLHPGEGEAAGFGIEQPQGKKKTSEALQEQLQILLGRYSENHPDVARIKADIEKVKILEKDREAGKGVEAAKGSGPGVSPTSRPGTRDAASSHEPAEIGKLRQQLLTLQAQIKGSDKELADRSVEQQRITRDLDIYQRRLESLPVREQEMAQLTRDYEISKQNYKSLLDKRMAASMALDMERRQQSERFIVLDRAQTPEIPIKPKRPLLYAAGFVLGLGLAMMWGMMTELRQNVILGEWELPEDTLILARLPYIEVHLASNQAATPPRKGLFGRKEPSGKVSMASLAPTEAPSVVTSSEFRS